MTKPLRWLAAALALVILGIGALLLLSREPTGEARVVREVASREALPGPHEPLEQDATTAEREAVGAPARDAVASAAERLDPVAEPLRDAPSGPALVVHLASGRGGALSGGGARVELERAGHEAPGSRRAGPGAFTFARLAPGAWTVRARAAAHEETTREVVVPEGGETLEIELVLAARPAVRIAVVTPDGEPFVPYLERHMQPPRAIATRERPERLVSELLTHETRDACGGLHTRSTAGLDERFIGLLELRCEPPVWVNLALGVDVLESRLLEREVDELVFTLDPDEVARFYPTVTLRVVDAITNEPLEATAHAQFGFWNGAFASGGSGGITGSFEFQGLPGPMQLELSHNGYEPLSLDVVLPRAPEHDLGTLAMTPRALGVLVLDLDLPVGAPQASLKWAPIESTSEPTVFTSWKQIDVGPGEARLELGEGAWVVWSEARVDGRAYGTQRHLFEITPGEHRAALALVPCLSVTLRAPDRRSIEVFQDAPDVRVSGPTVCGPDDRVLELVPGAYHVVAVAGDGSRSTVPFVVTPPAATVDLR